MAHPKEISIASYQYNLPDEKIAQYPVEPRDSSKLLTYRKGQIDHKTFNQLPKELPSNSHLIFNNTKVVPARLFFRNRNGRVIEVFCLEPQSEPSAELALSQTKSTRWWCMVGGAKKWKEEKLTLQTGRGDLLNVKKIDREDVRFLIEFSWEPKNFTFSQLLEEAGKVPLPPYMTREAEEEDKSRYQTVFAKVEGSVAAPTAGKQRSTPLKLHYT
jgi:S-adenosylmethionine:tRNA ribosyltransferase-isomerase